jgi:hypothetical protein
LRPDRAEFGFPITQHVRLNPHGLGHLTDAIVELYGDVSAGHGSPIHFIRVRRSPYSTHRPPED